MDKSADCGRREVEAKVLGQDLMLSGIIAGTTEEESGSRWGRWCVRSECECKCERECELLRGNDRAHRDLAIGSHGISTGQKKA